MLTSTFPQVDQDIECSLPEKTQTHIKSITHFSRRTVTSFNEDKFQGAKRKKELLDENDEEYVSQGDSKKVKISNTIKVGKHISQDREGEIDELLRLEALGDVKTKTTMLNKYDNNDGSDWEF